jgi:hypothetical protein
MLEDTGIAPHGKRTMVFTVPGSLDLRSGSLRELCKAVAQFCEVRYGIVYEWQKACGPTYYGLGIVQSSQHCHISPIEEEKIGIWFRERIDSRDSAARNRHLSGKLRDVYPLNFLSDVHLNVPLRGMTMREWIESNAGRGSLEKLAGKSWSWTIPSKSLGEIRKCLAQEGLIICEPADESQ